MGFRQLSIRRATSLGVAVTSTTLLFLAGCQSPLGTDESTQPEERPSFATTSGAATFYVSPSGSDKHSGTSPSSAWKTLSKVSGRTYAGGTQILFQGGATFSGRL